MIARSVSCYGSAGAAACPVPTGWPPLRHNALPPCFSLAPAGDCPRGDDPKTDGEAERQLIKCTATAGTFQLSFRQSLTDYLSYDITAADLKAALEGLDTVAEVTIDYSNAADDTAPLCDATGDTIAQITFTQNFGDLPNLILEDGDNLTPDANAVRCNGGNCSERRCVGA